MSHYEPTSPTTPTPATPVHPFANTKSLLTVIRDDHVDLQAEADFMADFEVRILHGCLMRSIVELMAFSGRRYS